MSLVNPFPRREGTPTPIWETDQFFEDLAAGEPTAVRIAEFIRASKFPRLLEDGYMNPNPSNIGNRLVDFEEQFDGAPRYVNANSDLVDATKAILSRIRIEQRYPHAYLGSFGYDRRARKFFAFIHCMGCGDYGRRVYTSDLWQVQGCLVCSQLTKATR